MHVRLRLSTRNRPKVSALGRVVSPASRSIGCAVFRVLEHVVQAQSEGKTPEQIQELFAVKLSLAQVYSALAYADENREEIEAEYAEHGPTFGEGLRARDEYLKKHTPGR